MVSRFWGPPGSDLEPRPVGRAGRRWSTESLNKPAYPALPTSRDESKARDTKWRIQFGRHGNPSRRGGERLCVWARDRVWDHRNETLLWVDIKNPAIWRYHPATGKHSRVEAPERVGFVALTHDPDIADRRVQIGPGPIQPVGGEIQPLVSPEPDGQATGSTTAMWGRTAAFISAPWTMTRRSRPGRSGAGTARSSTRFRGQYRRHQWAGVQPRRAQTIYTIDTLGARSTPRPGGGGPGRAPLFIRVRRGVGQPGRLAVDAEGHLWVCHWGGSRITRLGPRWLRSSASSRSTPRRSPNARLAGPI